MYVQPISAYNVSMNGNKPERVRKIYNYVKQKAFDILPNADINAKDGTEWVDSFNNKLSNPAINRAIMGGTALLFQPFIDAKNHKVDDETRAVSINRTIARTVIGAGVGICIRGGIYKAVKAFTNLNGTKPINKILLPRKYASQMHENLSKLDCYRSALSTVLALVVMLFTNFAIDAPLTKLLTNYFNDKNFSKKFMGKEVKDG